MSGHLPAPEGPANDASRVQFNLAPARFPDPRRFDYGHPLALTALHAMDEAEMRGAQTYQDPISGFLVFTRDALLRRGLCCHNLCRHCPYLSGSEDQFAADLDAKTVIALFVFHEAQGD